jgi:DNA-binding SARP family transcriptional activator
MTTSRGAGAVPGLEVDVLGPVRVRSAGVPLELGSQRHRQVVAALALAAGEPVSGPQLIERIWGERPPATALATLHGYIAALRRILEPGRAPRSPSDVLVTEGDAYVLRVGSGDRDEHVFEERIRSARTRLVVVGDHLRPRVGRDGRETVERALDELDDALALWRGDPYADLVEDPVAAAHRARLEDLRRVALELRVVSQIALGRHDVVRTELEARTAEYALHERWWALRAVALARESRQADALAVLDELRAQLVDELGVDMSPPLQELRTAILRQDPSVVAPASPTASTVPVLQARSNVRRSPWRMLGRQQELAQLRDALDRAREGQTAFALLSGPAGIGKSRLVEEISLPAEEQGWVLALGQCTQDAGSPPMWPWFSVLEALGTPLDLGDAGEAGSIFRVRADLVARIRRAAERQPLLLVLEDLHWADASTLAVLRLLVQTVAGDRMMVVGTWRSTSPSSSDLSALAEAFARRHAVRCELGGLDEHVERQLFEAVAGRDLPEERAAALHHRTGGSPFYVVEFARLATASDDVRDQLLGSNELPASIREVLGRRLSELPDGTVGVLRSAAVLGHSFDLETLGDVTQSDPTGLLDAIEPALTAGLLAEERPEVFSFSHALVADALIASTSATRLARTHQLIAEILERRPGREAEVARHWQAAGPRHVGRAWRALSAAARTASALYAHLEAAQMLQVALDLQSSDREATAEDRLELLRQAQDACRWAAMRPELIALVEQAVLLATSVDDVVRAAEAATVPSGMIWRSAPDGEINDVVVGALRAAAQTLPASEAALRCRVLTALTIELYEVTDLQERVALCDEAIATARELDDPALLGDLLVQAAIATWAPSTAAFRLRAAEEAVALAHGADRRYSSAMALTLLANVHGELGRPADLRDAARSAREVASELKVVYAELALDVFELAWAAAAGDVAACDAILAAARGHLHLLDIAGADGGLPFGPFDLYALQLWRGQASEAVPALAAEAQSRPRLRILVALALARADRLPEAVEHVDLVQVGDSLEREDELACPLWCAAAEMAYHLGETELAELAYRLLEPYAGRGSGADGFFLGPVDAFLALAARATGDRAGARAHADRALELVDSWGLPLVRAWLEELRSASDF